MANWTKRIPAGNTPRRKWDLEDRTSLNNLKYHFATDGCSDIQFDLARQLLDNNSDESTSHIQGIHWLLCAAQQGHEEAFNMLDECYKNGRGITESNEIEVRSCLSMTAGERAARKAARELFACLSNGGEHITPKQLEKRMREIYKLQKKRRRRGSSSASVEEEKNIKANGHAYLSPHHVSNSDRLIDGYVITEAHLVTAAVDYSHGRLPPVNNVLTLSIPHPGSLDHVPCFHRLFLHPLVFLTLLYHRFVNTVASFPGALPTYLKVLIPLLIYSVITTEDITAFLPIILYSISLCAMIWSTFKMLKTKHEFIDFRIWSGLFLSYGDRNVDAGGSENLFLRNNMKPYLYFFLAFVINFLVYPIVRSKWILHSETTVISFALVFITMIAFMYSSPRYFPDSLILVSFGINVLAKYPYENDTVVLSGWRFLDLKVPTFCSFVIGNGIEFCLNCRAVLYLLIPGLLYHLARRSDWHGIYKYLIPHCVTLSWLQLCLASSQSATTFGLVRAALGLSGILLFLPLFGIVTLMIPIFLLVEWLGLSNLKMRISTTLIAISVALLGFCVMAANKKTQKYVTVLQVTICLLATSLLTLPYMTSNFQTNQPDSTLYGNIHHKSIHVDEEDLVFTRLSWESFYNYCGPPALDNLNKIEIQLRCSQLEDVRVKWQGVISNIEILKVNNIRAALIKNYLPEWFGDLLKCMYGEKNKVICTDNENCGEVEQVYRETKKCNLDKWNIYEYEIKVRIASGLLSKPMEVSLIATDHFANFTQNLNDSDRIWFEGTLTNSHRKVNNLDAGLRLGVGRPIVQLTGIGCVFCRNKELASTHLTKKINPFMNARMRDLMLGIKYLLNVVFNPLLTFK